MGIAFTGLQTNIDTDAIISQLMSVERVPLNRQQMRRDEQVAKQNALSEISSKLSWLRTAVSGLKDASTLTTVGVKSSDTAVVKAANANAQGQGAYSVEVNRLASAERWVQGAGPADLADPVGAGRFVYTYDGQTRTIMTDDETTLEDLRGLINNDSGNPGVTASIIEHAGTFHLMLGGEDVGSDYAITIEDQTDLAGFLPDDFQRTQAAQDAQVRVDGFPAGEWIERSGNTLTDVIPGVTLDLVSTGTATVTMSRNTSPVMGKLQTFVDAYNGLAEKIDLYTGYSTATEQGGVLQGDLTTRGFLSNVRSRLLEEAVGFDASSDSVTRLSQIGIEIDKTGQMSLNHSRFSEAMENDVDGVLALLGAAGTGTTDDDRVQFTKAETVTQAGAYDLLVEVDGDEIVTAKIRLAGESDWRDMTVEENVLKGMIGQPEQGLHLSIDIDSVAGSVETTVRVREGVAGRAFEYLDQVLDPVDGAVEVKQGVYESNLKAINRRIDALEDRLVDKEERLIEEYARLEASLSRIESMNSAFEALFQQLSSNRQNSDS